MLKIKLKSILAALLLVLSTSYSVAQIENQGATKFFGSNSIENSKVTRTYVISYKDIFSMNLDESTIWVISDLNSKELIKEGTGLLKHVFNKPGEYLVYTHVKQQEIDDCSKHEHLNYHIQVTENHMLFDFSSAIVSPQFIGGTQNTYKLQVEVFFENYYDKKVSFAGTVQGVGLGVDLNGSTKSEIQLNKGLNKIEYSINGICKKGGYLTLDFNDVNGNLQSYYLTEQID